MRYKELKALGSKELEAKKNELLLTLMKENAQVAIGTIPKSPGILKEHKKTIARIRTAQRAEAPKQ